MSRGLQKEQSSTRRSQLLVLAAPTPKISLWLFSGPVQMVLLLAVFNSSSLCFTHPFRSMWRAGGGALCVAPG